MFLKGHVQQGGDLNPLNLNYIPLLSPDSVFLLPTADKDDPVRALWLHTCPPRRVCECVRMNNYMKFLGIFMGFYIMLGKRNYPLLSDYSVPAIISHTLMDTHSTVRKFGFREILHGHTGNE